MIITVDLNNGTVMKRAEDDEPMFITTVVCLKVEGDQLFEMDEEGDWNLIT